ncbi:MAG: S-layer family protein [Pseudanabaenales cyanobacterium]|nr:S-layer family protein [Pseudanabaenales cyanobacterium]
MKPYISPFWGISAILLSWFTFPDVATAQISPDGSLSTTITTPDGLNFTIDAGDRMGDNLFHSFDQFSIPTTGSASFNNAVDVENIISRITGGNISNIDGWLSANGNANLFLLNPNGIVFGPNAALNIGGSFIGSTADSLQFADGREFSAADPQAPPLLTMNAPVGLQYGATAGDITVQGAGNNLFLNSAADPSVNRAFRPPGLQVNPGQTLALVGGDVTLEGGNLTAADGRIELGSVAAGTVTLIPTNPGWTLGYENVADFQNIQLSQAASLEASGDSGGHIQVKGRNVTIADASAILADTLGNGSGGTLAIRATDTVLVTGSSFPPLGSPFTSRLSTDAAPGATGQGGILTIETARLQVTDGAQISNGAFSSGDAGALSVIAQDVEVVGGSIIGPSGLFAPVAPGATGKGGDLTIQTERLRITDGGQIFANTFGFGDAGNLTVQAQEVDIRGGAPGGPSGLFTAVGAPFATGNGGNLTIDTEYLRLSDGAQIASSTLGAGDAGDLTVRADLIELIGDNAGGRSGLFASAIFGPGDGGNLVIATNQLIVRDGAIISTSNFSSNNPNVPPGQGSAGNLNIAADTILLDNQGSLTAEVAAGERGNISLSSSGIVLRRGSEITTNAQGRATGGNLLINSDILVALENSDITANAENSFGGRVIVNALGILGAEFRPQLTSNSDITASSELGVEFSGVVELNTPDVDPSQGLVELPGDIVDITRLIAQSCRPKEEITVNEFTISGRGGLPPNPSELLSESTVLADFGASNLASTSLSRFTRNHKISTQAGIIDQSLYTTTDAIVEAQGWMTNPNGRVTLVAAASQITPQSPWSRSAECHDF